VLAIFCWTKSLSCTGADFTGMSYQFKVFKYSEFISLAWKGPYYDKISVTSVKKEFLDSKKTLRSLQLSKSRIPSLSSERPSETRGHSSVSNINNDAFNQGFSGLGFRSLLQRYVSRRFCTDSKSKKSDPLHLSGRRDIPSGLSTVQSIIRPDDDHPNLLLCLEASNYSRLHPSERNGKSSSRAFQSSRRIQRSSEIVQRTWLYRLDAIQCSTSIRVFASRHSYGKTASTVRTMCIPIQKCSFIRQVMCSKFKRPDVSLRGPDAQASYMEIACIRSTIQTTAVVVRTHQALIWKLRVGKVRPFGR
jgi:hypothetical protein